MRWMTSRGRRKTCRLGSWARRPRLRSPELQVVSEGGDAGKGPVGLCSEGPSPVSG